MFHVEQNKKKAENTVPLWAIRACIIGFWRAGVHLDAIAKIYEIPVFMVKQYISSYTKTRKYKESIIEQPVN